MKLRAPTSLSTQLALVMALAVLAAAAVQLVVLMLERNRTGLIEASGPAITRFADLSSEALTGNWRQLDEGAGQRYRRRSSRLTITDQNYVVRWEMDRHRQLEQRLQRVLADQGHPDVSVMAATRILDRPDQPGPMYRSGLRRDQQDRRRLRIREIVLAVQLAPDRWITGVYMAPVPPNDEFGRLFLGVLVAVGCVLGAAIWMSSRLVRPLRELATAATQFGGSQRPEALAVRGPREIRRSLAAFNNMSDRVSDLLREKDVMLGALGHDLRTPLASLRIRVESMEPESEREKAITTIEETTRLLESILDFARTGKASSQTGPFDLREMLARLIEDYVDQGRQVVLDAAPVPTPVVSSEELLSRLFRNLIDNACQHATTVTVKIEQTASHTTISVLDDGPGIPEEQLQLVRQPFYRTDASRNRRGGGSGLGLALADSIVRTLGGDLHLTNRKPRGLSAVVTLPSYVGGGETTD